MRRMSNSVILEIVHSLVHSRGLRGKIVPSAYWSLCQFLGVVTHQVIVPCSILARPALAVYHEGKIFKEKEENNDGIGAE
jgi:hypothetical protein